VCVCVCETDIIVSKMYV